MPDEVGFGVGKPREIHDHRPSREDAWLGSTPRPTGAMIRRTLLLTTACSLDEIQPRTSLRSSRRLSSVDRDRSDRSGWRRRLPSCSGSLSQTAPSTSSPGERPPFPGVPRSRRTSGAGPFQIEQTRRDRVGEAPDGGVDGFPPPATLSEPGQHLDAGRIPVVGVHNDCVHAEVRSVVGHQVGRRAVRVDEDEGTSRVQIVQGEGGQEG